MWHRSRQGFTLIEMLAALAISAIGVTLAMSLWFTMQRSVLERHKSGLDLLGWQTESMALDARLSSARAFVSMDDHALVWESAHGDLDTLSWYGDSLRLNQRVIYHTALQQVGFMAYAASDFSADLDRDYSHSLDAQEMSRVAMVEVRIQSATFPSVLLRQAIRGH